MFESTLFGLRQKSMGLDKVMRTSKIGSHYVPDFDMEFDLGAYQELDQFALLCCQEYNYGNTTDWFGSFRGGYYGSCARIYGVRTHYLAVHAWIPRSRMPAETEYHLASIFFNMDSAVECLTYAFNALGYCASGNTSFRDVTKPNMLRQISPYDIIGRARAKTPSPPLSEYKEFFPSVKQFWTSKIDMLATIFEQHDVSKHRHTIFTGGKARTDPPPGFYESMEIDDSPSQRARFWPMKEIILEDDPKSPRQDRMPQPKEDRKLLEQLVPEFRDFVVETGIRALQDARANIELKVCQFRKP